MKNITIIGGGTMGFGLAFAFAKGGKQVTLVSRQKATLEKAQRNIADTARSFALEGAIKESDVDKILTFIQTTTDLESGVRTSDWVIEAIPEVLQDKQKLFTKLDELLPPETLITSTTSSFPITLITASVHHPERMMVTHFLNPPHLIPLVEVVPNATTDRRFVDRVMAELYDCSFQPIVLNKEAPGFIANRLQGALFREVLNILEQGIADPEAIDTAVKMGVGFRWAVTGPLETADFGGLDTFALAAASLVPHLGTTTPVAVLQEKAQAGHLGVKSGKGFYDYTGVDTAELTEQRDRQLIRLKSLKS